MMEIILIILLSLVFLGTFITRNLLVKTKTKQRIRAASPIVTATTILTTLCIFMTILSTASNNFYKLSGELSFLRLSLISYIGLSIFAISILLGWFFSAQLKESWRVGVHEDQRPRLIQEGIYKYIRNPYFLSYFIMFFGLFFVRPSLLILLLIAITSASIHLLVLKEEAYLSKIHGKQYKKYKEITGRYSPRFVKI